MTEVIMPKDLDEALTNVIRAVAQLKTFDYPLVIQAKLPKETDYDFSFTPEVFQPNKIEYVKKHLYMFNSALAPIGFGYKYEKVRENSCLE